MIKNKIVRFYKMRIDSIVIC